MNRKQQLLIGLPGSGKTTFLAALWHLVESEEVPAALRLVELRGDRTHLNHIRRCWLGCRQIERTTLQAENSVSLLLAERKSGAATELLLPDMSGESFRLQWRDRQWTQEYGAIVGASAGGLLVVHPSQIQEPVRIDEADTLRAEIASGAAPTNDDDSEMTPWDPDAAPTQAQLVDLLQFLVGRVAVVPFRLAVIVSAWDLVEEADLSPEEWCMQRLPLLHQFLHANAEQFTARYYGVSAQGGDLTVDSERLRKTEIHAARIRINGLECIPHDISAPIRWVMGNAR